MVSIVVGKFCGFLERQKMEENLAIMLGYLCEKKILRQHAAAYRQQTDNIQGR